MNQQDANKLMANERIQELNKLHDELGTLKWAGADEGWERAIIAVRNHVEERAFELAHKYMPEAVDYALGKQASVSGTVGNA